MATMRARSSGGGSIFSAKALLLYTGVLSAVVALRLSVPSILVFVSSDVPRIYVSLLAWLTPPYLYFVINAIIISIAASSRFQNSVEGGDATVASSVPLVSGKIPLEIRQEYPAPVAYGVGEVVKAAQAVEVVARTEFGVPVVFGAADPYGGRDTTEEKVVVVKMKDEVEEVAAAEEEFVISRSSWTPRMRESGEIPAEYSNLPAEKPLVSVRFGGRKSVKASPEGKALGVARPRRNETLESTWKTITDGRAMPLTRHLKKSDTWDVHGGRERAAARDPSPMRKSETFNERRATSSSTSPSPSPSPGRGLSGGRLRREPSLGQDELNRRVEAFIKKFNEEMRLQRQESFKHYLEMVNRGSH